MAEMHNHLDDVKNDEPSNALNAALAKYTAVEPRAGLEDRILANLRAKRSWVPDRAWWRAYSVAWSIAGALAAVVIVALALAWRSGRLSRPVMADHPSSSTQAPKAPPTQVASNSEHRGVRPSASSSPRRIAGHRPRPAVEASAPPKLDQFPSPRPLSEEELALARYVRNFPSDATQVAQAQAASEREVLARMQALANQSTESN